MHQKTLHFFTSSLVELAFGRALKPFSISVAKPSAHAGRNPRAVDLLPPPFLIPPGALRSFLFLTQGRRARPWIV